MPRKANHTNLLGKQFGYLEVRAYAGTNKYRMAQWWCICSCGSLTLVRALSLVSQHTKSCGCKSGGFKHGDNRVGKSTSEYNSWIAMKKRCLYKKATNYPHYGGSGIQIHPTWINSYWNFKRDMGIKPDSSYTLDRINPFGNYTPENCRWASKKQQSLNTRKNYGKNSK